MNDKALRDMQSFFSSVQDNSIRVNSGDEITAALLKNFMTNEGISPASPLAMAAVGHIRNVVKYFMKPDADGWYDIKEAYNYAYTHPQTMKTFAKFGIEFLEPVEYTKYETKKETLYGVIDPPTFFYVDDNGKTRQKRVTKDVKVTPTTLSDIADNSGLSATQIDSLEQIYNGKKKFVGKIIVIFDLDGTLAKWPDDWDKGPLKSEAWKAPGYFYSLEPHELINFANELIMNPMYEVFILSSTSAIPGAAGEKYNWCRKKMPNIKTENILFVESGNLKALAVRPDSSVTVFEDHRPVAESLAEHGANVVLVENNLTRPNRDKGKCADVCNAAIGYTETRLQRLISGSLIDVEGLGEV